MEQKGMKGIKTVFQFTWQQTIKGKGFMASTIGIAALLLCGIVAVYGLIGYLTSNNEPSPVKHIYVINDSDLDDFSTEYYYAQNLEEFSKVEVKLITEDKDSYLKQVMEKQEEYEEDIILLLSKEEEEYQFTAITVENTQLSDSDVFDAVEPLEQSVYIAKLSNSGITQMQLALLSTPMDYEVKNAGEESKSIAYMLISMLFPMIFSLVIYMMVLLYGQSITKSIIAEKNSKIIETLLTSARPYAIISGKMLAQVLAAIMQMLLWVVSIVGGIFIGHQVALSFHPGFKDALFEVGGQLKEQNLASAFSPAAVVLALVFAIVGFIFYCAIASLVGANVSKSEDLGSAMSVFQVPVMVGFLVSYFVPLSGVSGALLQAIRYIPVTSAFLTPVDILLGNMSLAGGFLSLFILLLATVALLVFAGQCYKNKIFYNGKPFFFRKQKE